MADKVIEDLTAVSSANLTDVLPVVQGTSPAKKATLTQIRTAMALGAIYQPLDATLTALAALDSSAGFVKQTAADTFSKVTPAVTDLAALTVSRALVSDGSGIISAATTTSTEIGYVNGVTSAIQTQLDAKAPLASPTFTGTVTVPTPFTIGAVSVTATGTELNYVAGVTSAIQTQLNAKQASLGFTPEDSANKNASGGYAGLTAGKITASQMQEVLAVADLTTYSGVSGSGSTAIAATFTSLTTNDVLTWSGTNWINQAPSGGLSGLTTNYLPVATGASAIANSLFSQSGNSTTPIFNFGAADASHPAWKRSGTEIRARLGDDSGVATFRAGVIVSEQFATNTVTLGWNGIDISRYDGHIALGTEGANADRAKLVNGATGDGRLQLFDGGGSVRGVFEAGVLEAATANGANLAIRTISESITLNTGGTTTDSSANLLPANSYILGVTARITTTITTATDWKLGDGTTAARFTTANSTLTSGTTDTGLLHLQGSVSTDAAGPIQVAAAKLRITTTGTPGAGVIRVTVTYIDFNPPSS